MGSRNEFNQLAIDNTDSQILPQTELAVSGLLVAGNP
jgi:hypothetical protein